MNLRGLAPIIGFSLAAAAVAPPAFSHISLEQGGTHLSRYGDSQLKAGPCGMAGGTRGTHIYTYAPGETVTITIDEFIAHPSYFRWAFDADGDSAFKEPASILPIDPKRPCPIDSGDHCGASDFYNNAAVLPGMDDLDPHLAGASGTKYTFKVTMPNVECTNCTLQVIQVMEDNLAHGDYDPTPGVGVEDIYHQCIDIVLKNPADADAGMGTADAGMGAVDAGTPVSTNDAGHATDATVAPGNDASVAADSGGTAPNGNDAATPPMGGTDSGTTDGTGSGKSSGGCAVSPGTEARVSSALSIAFALGLLGVRRRRSAQRA